MQNRVLFEIKKNRVTPNRVLFKIRPLNRLKIKKKNRLKKKPMPKGINIIEGYFRYQK